MRKVLLSALFASVCFATQADAAAIDLKLIASFDRTSPFGLAYDGSHIWWSNNRRVIHKMTTAGVDTGDKFTGPVWGELAWNGSQLLSGRGNKLYMFDRDGSNQTTKTIGFAALGGLNDGLDWDNGELWASPDVSNVYRVKGDLSGYEGAPPFLGGRGGYSGVERIQAKNKDYLVVVNDAKNPRELCVHELDATLVGCQQFQNARYEGLAFDGRYVWAADYFGNKIDKYDILGGGGSSIIDTDPKPNVVPLPAALPLFGAALAGLAMAGRRRRA